MFPNHFAWNCGWVRATVIRREEEVPLVHFGPSEGETTTDCRSKVAVVVIGDAGTMRNGDGQTAAQVGIRNSGESVETLGEVMIYIERHLVESELTTESRMLIGNSRFRPELLFHVFQELASRRWRCYTLQRAR